jgi:hypothetical protein
LRTTATNVGALGRGADLLLCVRRALMDKSPVTPSEVTTAMLVEDCELSEEQARSALTA